MADPAITARIGGDASGLVAALEQGKQAAGKFATDFGHVLERKLSFKDVFKGVLQGIGIASVEKIADKIVSPFREGAESAQKIEEYTNRAADATERLIKLRQTDNQQLATSEKSLERMMKMLESKKNEGPSKSYLGGLIDRGSAFDVLFGFSRREDAARKESVQELGAKIQEKSVEIAEQQKKIDAEKAARADKQAKEDQAAADKLAESKKELAAFDKETARDKMSDDQKLAELQKDQADTEQQIAKYNRFVAEGGKLTNDGVQELLALKKKQADTEKEIGALTKKKVEDEKAVSEVIRLRTVGRGDAELSDRELERKRQALAADVSSRTAALSQGAAMLGISTADRDPLLGQQQLQLQQLEAELALRERTRRFTAIFGADRAFSMLDGLTENRFDRINSTQTDMSRTNYLLEQISKRLNGGIATMPAVAIPGPGGG